MSLRRRMLESEKEGKKLLFPIMMYMIDSIELCEFEK